MLTAPKRIGGIRLPADTETWDPKPKRGTLQQGSITAKVLAGVWTGADRAVVIDSPPGAGKTTMVATLAANLATRAGLRIIVACNTRNQVVGVVNKLYEQMPADRIACLTKRVKDELPDKVRTTIKANQTAGYVQVLTVAACKRRVPPEVDVMILDEAYQATFADMAWASANAAQVVLVGDPGQIGPVVTCNTDIWERNRNAPHRRAPKIIRRRDDATVHHMPVTWRLGQATVNAISPLYDFAFTSRRPARHIDGLPEIRTTTVDPNNDPADPAVMTRVVELAENLIGGTHTETINGETTTRTITETDIAVVVSHNAQVTVIAAKLRSDGYELITVGTADRLQGGEWAAVIAVDPLIGHEAASTHSLSPGRLCVMASRHSTHLTWVHDNNWREALTGMADTNPQDVKLGIEVRQRICAGSTVPV